ncbi:MAG: exodeoxyribonuclease VII small subunit [Methanobacteriota archaeon]|jgi:exodeoxyribonuclease VII small subunit|nr:MAG: exodeoxyribonuclease VII small subunit [Euryarchaeota archaeon TMED103]RAH12646.1 MAG: exodeoxyribonuclease VII small subunit [Euryarchaeota archaeon]|tara:strand:+ start:3680 stop:3901 length:222 start_codon:yes stop_codon:yes gene_type:complete
MTEDTYSDALRRLETIVAELERGGMDLEATLERFEEGSKLLERCQAELKDAEGRLENLRLPEAEAMIEEAKKE